MVSPVIIGAGIQAGASLLGGLMGPSPSEQIGRQVGYQKSVMKQSPKWIRYGAEKAGFNPLVFAGPLSPTSPVPIDGSLMGQAIAQAGLALGGGFSEVEQLKIQQAQLEMENQRLAMLAQEGTLTPDVPQVYYGSKNKPKSISSNPQRALVNVSSVAPSKPPVPSGADASGLKSAIDPSREVEKTPITNSAMMSEVELPIFKKVGLSKLYVPGQDEPMGIDELATLAVSVPPNVIGQAGYKMGKSLRQKKADNAMSEWFYREKYKIPKSQKLPIGWKSGKSPQELYVRYLKLGKKWPANMAKGN